ncbi:HAD family acid phosphatase [Sphingomonas sp. MJ1 (PH-R8)]|uniref:HAD family acid phosphatase n=1 Tax=Sphingomonas sp. MJ1 (PH-R8) TaxID=3112950 RepID=UPI003A872B16
MAAVPVGAAAVIGKNVVFPGGGEDEKAEDAEKAARKQAREQRRQAKREVKRRATGRPAQHPGVTIVSGPLPPPTAADLRAPMRTVDQVMNAGRLVTAGSRLLEPAPPGMQYLYGSGEAAALSAQAYRALTQHVRINFDYRQSGSSAISVALAPGSTLKAPRFAECGAKPLAIVLDIDETVLLNLGYEADEAERGLSYDDARWRRWEATGAGQVEAVPGAADAIASARQLGVAVIFLSNRSAANAAATARALEGAGLGRAVAGETLFLRQEGASTSKDSRRAQVAEKYCIIGLVGDQLGDFSDLFSDPALTPAQRRGAAAGVQVAPLWGAGWFMLPNPVYGTGLKGGIADVFPANRRWTDPGAAAAAGPPAATPKE